jgi:hypothetical protein
MLATASLSPNWDRLVLPDGVFHWTAKHPEWDGPDVAAYAIDDGDYLLLIDPIAVPLEVDALAVSRGYSPSRNVALVYRYHLFQARFWIWNCKPPPARTGEHPYSAARPLPESTDCWLDTGTSTIASGGNRHDGPAQRTMGGPE